MFYRGIFLFLIRRREGSIFDGSRLELGNVGDNIAIHMIDEASGGEGGALPVALFYLGSFFTKRSMSASLSLKSRRS